MIKGENNIYLLNVILSSGSRLFIVDIRLRLRMRVSLIMYPCVCVCD